MAVKTYMVIEAGAGQIFKGDEDNSRFAAGEVLELDEAKGAALVARGFVTGVSSFKLAVSEPVAVVSGKAAEIVSEIDSDDGEADTDDAGGEAPKKRGRPKKAETAND